MAVVLPSLLPPTRPNEQLAEILITEIDQPTRNLVNAIISTSTQLCDDNEIMIAGARVALEEASRSDMM
jgi:hypothetical protein